MDAEACRMEAKILRTAADASLVPANRAWLLETADDWDAVSDGLVIAEQLGEEAHVAFCGSLRRGQSVLRQGIVPGFMWVRRFSRDGIAVFDDESGQLLWINPADMKHSPIVARGEA